MSSIPFFNKKTWWQIGIGLASLLGLYIVAAFFVPIAPLSTSVSDVLTSTAYYKATWTTVYAHDTKISGANVFNSELIGGSVLRTPNKIYLFGEELVWADPLSTVVVTETSWLGGGLHSQIPVYLYDDDNVYVRSNIVLPRPDDGPASFVYHEYKQDKFYNTERSIKKYDSSWLISHWENGEKLQ